MKDQTHYSISESAEILRVKEPTIRSWISQEILPTIRIGRRVFIKNETIDGILENGFSTKNSCEKL